MIKKVTLKPMFALLLLVASIISSGIVYGQSKPADLFEKNCSICHKISTEKLIGPGLAGITQRRDRAWIVKFVRSSKTMIESGDKTAVQVFNENNKIPMPEHMFLSEADVNGLIDYIANYKAPEKKAVTVDAARKDGFTRVEIQRGERMFYGLIPFEKGTLNCVSCHNTIRTDTLNWNPSAYDLAQAWLEKGGTNLYDVMAAPTSQKMTVAHGEVKLTDQEVYLISAFLSEVGKTGLVKEKTFPVRLMLFLLIGALMALALIDLFFTHLVRYKAIPIAVLILGLSVHGLMAMQESQRLSRTKDYAPDQPIKFSHKVHAGQNRTDCKYCHSLATYSKSAGFPSSNLCMNCHSVVKAGTRSGKFEINKIYRAEKTGNSIQWIRIHKLPDHAFFSHAQHANAGKILCQTCHGKVAEMDVMKQYADLSMGWCVNCHRQTKVNFENNHYYDSYKKLHDDLKSGKIDKVTADKTGGIDCMKCHY
jgi:cytochrome c2